MHNPLRVLAALLFAATLAHPATSLTIDNFEEGDFTVTDLSAPGAPTFGEQSGLLGSNVVGGVRLVRATAAGGVTSNALLVTTGGDDGAVLTTTGPPAGLSDFAFIYDGVAGGLSNAGIAGTLGLDLTVFTGPSVEVELSMGAVAGGIRITLWSSTASASSNIQPLVNGTNTILIDGTLLTLNLADIRAIQVAVVDLNPGETVTVSNISAIPEPGTGLLIAVGMVGLAVRRTRSR